MRNGSVWLVQDGTLYERSGNSPRFVHKEGYPAFRKIGPLNECSISFDSEFVYWSGPMAGPKTRISYGYRVLSASGPQWYWNPGYTLEGNYRFLAADNRQVLLTKHIKTKDSASQKVVFKIVIIDLVDGTEKELLSREEGELRLDATGIAADSKFTVLLSDGSLWHYDGLGASLVEIASGVIKSAVPGQVEIEMHPTFRRIKDMCPVRFPTAPFFGKEGTIFFPMVLREKLTWTTEALHAFWEDLPIPEQQKALNSGRWPPKEDTYGGSDEVFVVIAYDPIKKICHKVDPEALGNLVVKAKYTGQYQLVDDYLQTLGETKEGLIRPVTDLLSEAPAKR